MTTAGRHPRRMKWARLGRWSLGDKRLFLTRTWRPFGHSGNRWPAMDGPWSLGDEEKSTCPSSILMSPMRT